MNDQAQNTMTDEEINDIAAEMDEMESEIVTDETEESAETTAEESAETTATEPKKRGGKPKFFDNRDNIVNSLIEIDEADGEYHFNNSGSTLSRVLVMQLIDRGLVEARDSSEPREGRGRPKKVYLLTARGNSLVELASAAQIADDINTIAESTEEEFSEAMEAETA